MTADTVRAYSSRPAGRAVPGRLIAGFLLALFAIDNVLLLAFLGVSAGLVALAALVGATALFWLSQGCLRNMPDIPVSVVTVSLVTAVVLLVLGGEGRWFYANADWQIRDAVLADMARHPWPFVYDHGDETLLLRAPIGMYLLPALAGPGQSAEIALLLSNSLRFGLGIALASVLFESNWAKWTALACFILFSGWDIAGMALYALLGVRPYWSDLEPWNFGFQFTSHVAQLFWVPQHAIAGWVCAVAFLLWRRNQASIGFLAATLPLAALWSPLVLVGALPLAAFAGWVTLRDHALRPRDFALPAVAVVLAAASVFYLQYSAASVGGGMREARPSVFIFCFLLEVLPFGYLMLRDRGYAGSDRPVLWLVLAFLAIVPLFQIGQSSDLQMRASIMPLAILALAFAGWVVHLIESPSWRRGTLACAALVLAIGAVTPAVEVARVLSNETSPAPRCSLIEVWSRQTGLFAPYTTYVANVENVSPLLQRAPVHVPTRMEVHCWDKPWPVARNWNEPKPADR